MTEKQIIESVMSVVTEQLPALVREALVQELANPLSDGEKPQPDVHMHLAGRQSVPVVTVWKWYRLAGDADSIWRGQQVAWSLEHGIDDIMIGGKYVDTEENDDMLYDAHTGELTIYGRNIPTTIQLNGVTVHPVMKVIGTYTAVLTAEDFCDKVFNLSYDTIVSHWNAMMDTARRHRDRSRRRQQA